MKLLYLFLALFLFALQFIADAINQDKSNLARSVAASLPLPEVSRISKIATKYVSGANIPEVVNKPDRRAKISVVNNYKSAMFRRQIWSEVLKTLSEPVIGYNVTISSYYSKNPPPVQAFMKSESPIEINSQCLNTFNYFYVYPNLISCTPSPSKELLEIIFRYICMKSVKRIFATWTGSIFILREIIEKTLFSIKNNKVPQSVLNGLMSEYYMNPFKDFVPIGNKLGKHVNMDIEGNHIWQFIVARSKLLYNIDSPTRAPRSGEWAFVVISGNQTPPEFLYMREIRFMNTDSVQLITAIIFNMLLFKVKNPLQFKSFEVVIEDHNKKIKNSVNSNLLLAFAARIATYYSHISSDWNDQIDSLMEIDLEEKENNRDQTFIWNSKPLVSLAFEPDIVIPDQLVSNCVRYCEDLVSRGIVSVVGVNNEVDSFSFLQKKLENICKKLQNKILPYVEIYVEPEKNLPKSILKSSIKPSDPNKRKLRFNTNVQVSIYNKGGMVGDRAPIGNFTLGASLKTSLIRHEGSSTAMPEIPTGTKKSQTSKLDEDSNSLIDSIDSKYFQREDLFDKTPYPFEDSDSATYPSNSENLKSINSSNMVNHEKKSAQ
ncbi:uncharacterized protein cubi_03054 [Cryptosporidium ubiquitum]|uniref:Secreted protein n=1 Tax=Cryptosporidium ubiquitum TaxID=857276 RepID=A0A1J4MN94_9CRYT|nr:uncharacterized protein cubi_03054 [Cryptosporidium ubiquitum]OII74923.1 hypothetical protein cubi_03054 [Cryptosporidium ubiquitum]